MKGAVFLKYVKLCSLEVWRPIGERDQSSFSGLSLAEIVKFQLINSSTRLSLDSRVAVQPGCVRDVREGQSHI